MAAPVRRRRRLEPTVPAGCRLDDIDPLGREQLDPPLFELRLAGVGGIPPTARRARAIGARVAFIDAAAGARAAPVRRRPGRRRAGAVRAAGPELRPAVGAAAVAAVAVLPCLDGRRPQNGSSFRARVAHRHRDREGSCHGRRRYVVRQRVIHARNGVERQRRRRSRRRIILPPRDRASRRAAARTCTRADTSCAGTRSRSPVSAASADARRGRAAGSSARPRRPRPRAACT